MNFYDSFEESVENNKDPNKSFRGDSRKSSNSKNSFCKYQSQG